MYLDKKPQVDILRPRLCPGDLTVPLVFDVDTLIEREKCPLNIAFDNFRFKEFKKGMNEDKYRKKLEGHAHHLSLAGMEEHYQLNKFT